MATAAKLSKLKQRRAFYKGRLTFFTNQLDVNAEDADIESFMESLPEYRKTFMTIQDEIELLESELTDVADGDILERERFEEGYFTLMMRLKRLAVLPNPPEVEQPPQRTYQTIPKLPDLAIPKFDGTPIKWINFKN